MKNYIINSSILIAIMIAITGCEVTIDTEKPFKFIIKDKKPVEVYKKGMYYSKISESTPYSGSAFESFPGGEDYFELKNGNKNGNYYYKTKEGKILQEGYYKNGKKDGSNFSYNSPIGFTEKSIYEYGNLLQEIQVSNLDYKIKRDIKYKNNKPFDGYNYGENEYAQEDKRYIMEVYENGKFSLKYLTSREFFNRKIIEDLDSFLTR